MARTTNVLQKQQRVRQGLSRDEQGFIKKVGPTHRTDGEAPLDARAIRHRGRGRSTRGTTWSRPQVAGQGKRREGARIKYTAHSQRARRLQRPLPQEHTTWMKSVEEERGTDNRYKRRGISARDLYTWTATGAKRWVGEACDRIALLPPRAGRRWLTWNTA